MSFKIVAGLLLVLVGTAQSRLVALYSFEGDTRDHSGYGNDLESAAMSFANFPAASRIHGKYALFSDSDEQYCFSTNFSFPSSTPEFHMTVEFWAQMKDSACVFSALSNYNDVIFSFCREASMRRCYFTYDAQRYDIVSTNPLCTGGDDTSWHHVAITKSASKIFLYFDGQLEDSHDVPTVPTYVPEVLSIRNVQIDMFPFLGNLSEFRIWNTSRTQEEILLYMFDKLPLIGCSNRSVGEIVAGEVLCTACPDGAYKSSNACVFCSAGSHLVENSCIPCQLGKFKASEQGFCEDCPPGHYSDAPGSSECLTCPAGKYSSVVGGNSSLVCLPCAPNASSVPGSISADNCSCLSGFEEILGRCVDMGAFRLRRTCLAVFEDNTSCVRDCMSLHCVDNQVFQVFDPQVHMSNEIIMELVWSKVPSSSTLESSVTSDLFESPPFVQDNHAMLRLRDNRNGIANFSIAIGNRSIGFLLIRVLPVNDPPTLILSTSWTEGIFLQENSVNVIQMKVATNLTGGGWSEDQDMMFFSWKQMEGEPDLIRDMRFFCHVSLVDVASFCSKGEDVNLVVTPTPFKFGQAVFRVTLHDSGGVQNQGRDSTTLNMTIRVQSLPRLHLALQYPCDLDKEFASCQSSLNVIEGLSCDGGYDWKTMPSRSPWFEDRFQDFYLPVLRACNASLPNSYRFSDFTFFPGEAANSSSILGSNETLMAFDLAPELRDRALTFQFKAGILGCFEFHVLHVFADAHQVSHNLTLCVLPPPFNATTSVNLLGGSGWNVVPNAVSPLGDWPCLFVPLIVGLEIVSAQDSGGVLQCATRLSECKCFARDSSQMEFEYRLIVDYDLLILNSSFLPNRSLAVTTRDHVTGSSPAHVLLLVYGIPTFSAPTVIDVIPINTAPSFSLKSNVTVLEGTFCRDQSGWDLLLPNASTSASSGCQFLFPAFAQDILAGLPDREVCGNCLSSSPCDRTAVHPRACQHVSFQLFVEKNPLLFHEFPSMSTGGALRFILNPVESGQALVSVRLLDDGGTEHGGSDTSPLQNFTIIVQGANKRPSVALTHSLQCSAGASAASCTCPDELQVASSGGACAVTSSRAEIQVLEDFGMIEVEGFATEVSTGGALPHGLNIFSLDQADRLAFQGVRKDIYGSFPGLEPQTKIAMSPTGDHVYAAGFLNSTITILDSQGGAASMKFLDRRGNDEQRLRYQEESAFSTENPCSSSFYDSPTSQLLFVSQGCSNDRAGAPQDVWNDPNTDQVEKFIQANKLGYLWPKTVAYWELRSFLAHGAIAYDAATLTSICGGSVTSNVFVEPGRLSDLTGNLPDAELDICKMISAPQNLNSFFLNNGIDEGMQFPAAVTTGLYVARSLAPILPKLPTNNVTFETWVLFYPITPGNPSSGGIFSLANNNLVVPLGTALLYSQTDSSCTLRWDIIITAGRLLQTATGVIPNFKTKVWYHIVLIFDGFDASIYVNSLLLKQTVICSPPTPCQIYYPGRAVTDAIGNFSLGGGQDTLASSYFNLVGMMSTFKIYNVSLNQSEVEEAYNARKVFKNSSFPMDSFWFRTEILNGGIPFPTSLSSATTASETLEVIGVFKNSMQYACRWVVGSDYIETRATLHQDRCPAYTTLSCAIKCNAPIWPLGYKTSRFVIVEKSTWASSGTNLWQIVCFPEFNFGCKAGSPDVGGFKYQDLDPAYSLTKARGDLTYFVFYTQNLVKQFDSEGRNVQDKALSFSETVGLGTADISLFRVEGLGSPVMAVANYWDGADVNTFSSLSILDEKTLQASPIQLIPTSGATQMTAINVSGDTPSSPSATFIAIANFHGQLQLFAWRSNRAVQRVSVVFAGQGYLSGYLAIVSDQGSGFWASVSASPLLFVPTSNSIVGGSIVCETNFSCVPILSEGSGYSPSEIYGLGSQLADLDAACHVAMCDPFNQDKQCQLDRELACSSLLIQGQVEVRYPKGCAVDDSACHNTSMTDTISSVFLTSSLPGASVSHSNRCYRSSRIFHANEFGRGVSLRYSVKQNGSLDSLSFLEAADHGSNYTFDPWLDLEDDQCSCGTTISELRILDGGEGYTAGYITASGAPDKQEATAGQGFLAYYDVKGNITELKVLRTAVGFTSIQDVSITPSLDVRYITTFSLHSIAMYEQGNCFSNSTVVSIEAPEAVGAPTAQANVTWELDPSTFCNKSLGARYRPVALNVLVGGNGYTRIPRISLVDPFPDKGSVQPSLMPRMQLDYIYVNHDFKKASWVVRQSERVLTVEKNWARWFQGNVQAAQYVTKYDDTTNKSKGVDASMEVQHYTSLVKNSEYASYMVQNCENSLLPASWDIYEVVVEILNANLSNFSYRVFNGTLWKGPVPTTTLDQCKRVCLLESCSAITFGPNNNLVQGECWMSTRLNPSSAESTIWSVSPSLCVAPTPNGRKCRDLDWKDAYNRTCAVYKNLSLCSQTGTYFNGTFFPKLGSGWNFSNFNGTDASYMLPPFNGYNASDACCFCGRTGFGYKVFLRQYGNLTIYPKAVDKLLCSPYPSNASSCTIPMYLTPFPGGINKCCFDKRSKVPINIGKCTSAINCQPIALNIISVSFESTSQYVVLDASKLTSASLPGQVGEDCWMSFVSPLYSDTPLGTVLGATVEAVVEGAVSAVTIKKRGQHYTQEPFLVLWLYTKQSNHNSSLWNYKDDNTFFHYRPANIYFRVGFGNASGTFQGLNLQHMCGGDANCLLAPFGQGYGPCLTLVRASGAQLVASTSYVDLENVTSLSTAGSSRMAQFEEGGETYLAVANGFNGTGSHVLPSPPLGSPGADPFNSPSFKNFVAVAQPTMSQVYRLFLSSDGTLQHQLHYELETSGARDVTYFEFSGRRFLAFAQESAATSLLLEVTADLSGKPTFQLLQQIPTSGARRLRFFAPAYPSNLFLFVAQTGKASQCFYDDPLLQVPICGAEGASLLAGDAITLSPLKIELGAALDVGGREAQSMMMRWNGTLFQGVNSIKTLGRDLAGGQGFSSDSAVDLLPYTVKTGEARIALLNSQWEDVCYDNPSQNCSYFGGDTKEVWCSKMQMYECDRCPKTCGTCQLCSNLYRKFQAGTCQDQPPSVLLTLNITVPCSSIDCKTLSSCVACPSTCGRCQDCSLLVAKGWRQWYGPSENSQSFFSTGKVEEVTGLEGPSALVVSPDGRHLYVASYISSSVLVFDRNATTGSLSYRREATVSDPLNLVGLTDIVITQDGRHVYVSSFGRGSVFLFTRSITSGSLNRTGMFVSGTRDRAGSLIDGILGAHALVLDAANLHLYVAGFLDQGFAVFSRNVADGALTFVDRIKNGERIFPESIDPAGPVGVKLIPADGIGRNLTGAAGGCNFSVPSGTYLVTSFASSQLSVPHVMVVLRYDSASDDWVSVQEIQQQEAVLDLAAFSIVDLSAVRRTYLAAAMSVVNGRGRVMVYEWNDAKRLFVLHHTISPFQALPTDLLHPRRVLHFSVASTGDDFLAVSFDTYDNRTSTVQLFLWNKLGQTRLNDSSIVPGSGFDIFQLIPSAGAVDLNHLRTSCLCDTVTNSACQLDDIILISNAMYSEHVDSVEGWKFAVDASLADARVGIVGRAGRFEKVFGYRQGQSFSLSVNSFKVEDQGCFAAAIMADETDCNQIVVFKYLGGTTAASACPKQGLSCADPRASLCSFCLFQTMDGKSRTAKGKPVARWIPHNLSSSTPSSFPLCSSNMSLGNISGARGLHHFESGKEHYLAVAQSRCQVRGWDWFSSTSCRESLPATPRSAVLQWNSSGFTELATLTVETERMLRGHTLTAAERDIHLFSFRVMAGLRSSFLYLEVPAPGLSAPPKTLLLCFSSSYGAFHIDWSFPMISGMNGTSSLLLVEAQACPLDPSVCLLAPFPLGSHVLAAARIDRALSSVTQYPVLDHLQEVASWLRMNTSLTSRADDFSAGDPDLRGASELVSLDLSTFQQLNTADGNSTSSQWKFVLGLRTQQPSYEAACDIFPRPSCQPVKLLVDQISGDPGLLLEPPVLLSNGKLRLASASNKVGSAVFRVLAQDGQASKSSSAAAYFSLTVVPVDDAPSFTLQDVSVVVNSGPQTLIFATNVTPGVSTRVSQLKGFQENASISFQLNVSSCLRNEFGTGEEVDCSVQLSSFFSSRPTTTVIQSDDGYIGAITFEVVQNVTGFVKFKVVLLEDIAGGKVSEVRYFQLVVEPVNLEPYFDVVPVVSLYGDETTPVLNGIAAPLAVGVIGNQSVCSAPSHSPASSLNCKDPLSNPLEQCQWFERNQTYDIFIADIQVLESFPAMDFRSIQLGLDDFFTPSSFSLTCNKLTPKLFPLPDVSEVYRAGGVAALEDRLIAQYCQTCSEACTVALNVNAPLLSSGCLSFLVLPDRHAVLNITIEMRDSGGVSRGGVDSTRRSLILRILKTNSAPILFTRSNLSLLEVSSSFYQYFPLLQNISAGVNEPTQQVTVEIAQVSSQSPLFQEPPQIMGDGLLRVMLLPFRTGTAMVDFLLRDNGGTDNGGKNSSITSVFFYVVATNTNPFSNFPTSLMVSENAGLVQIHRFVQSLIPGTGGELWQKLIFNTSLPFMSENLVVPILFDQQTCSSSSCISQICASSPLSCSSQFPSIDWNGTLTMRSKFNAHGSTKLLVQFRDEGTSSWSLRQLDLHVVPIPRVFSVVPCFGPIAGGSSLTVRGQFFEASGRRSMKSEIAIGLSFPPSHVVQSDTEIVATTSPGVGSASVVVKFSNDECNPGGNASNPNFCRATALGNFANFTQENMAVFHNQFLHDARRAENSSVVDVQDLQVAAIPSSSMYRQINLIMGGTSRIVNPTTSGGGFVAMSPDFENPGTLELPSATVKLLPLKFSHTALAAKVFRGQLYIGGSFESAELNVSMSSSTVYKDTFTMLGMIARYDGNFLYKLGHGMNGVVYAIEDFMGMLVVGGSFTSFHSAVRDQNNSGPLALWDHSAGDWLTIPGSPPLGVVLCLGATNSSLFVGGSFTFQSSDGKRIQQIARFDSSGSPLLGTWNSLKDGLQGGDVYTLAVVQEAEEKVYVGGSFKSAGPLPARSIAYMLRDEWYPMGDFDGSVHALAPMGGEVFVGGSFTSVNWRGVVLYLDNLARWRDGSWLSVPGIGGAVFSLSTIRGCLYIGGDFRKVCLPSQTRTAKTCQDESSPSNYQPACSSARWCLASLLSNRSAEAMSCAGQEDRVGQVRVIAEV